PSTRLTAGGSLPVGSPSGLQFLADAAGSLPRRRRRLRQAELGGTPTDIGHDEHGNGRFALALGDRSGDVSYRVHVFTGGEVKTRVPDGLRLVLDRYPALAVFVGCQHFSPGGASGCRLISVQHRPGSGLVQRPAVTDTHREY